MKSYTDLEQSYKLAEILPLESADMFLAMNGTVPVMSKYIDEGLVTAVDTAITCWSFVALFRALPKNLDIGRPVLATNYRGYYWVEYFDEYMKETNLTSKIYNNPIDACYEMILKLHEQNFL